MDTVVIIGNGSLGTGLSYYVKKAGFEPRFLSRDGAIEMLGFKLRAPEETVPVHVPAGTKAEIGSADLCFVTVKAYQFRLALHQHAPLLKKGAVVIPIGNGAIDRELSEIATTFPDLHWRLGMTTLAVTDEDKGRLALKNPDPKVLFGPRGETEGQAPSAAENKLTQALPKVFRWTDDIAIPYRKKWLFNTVLNSLCGVLKLGENGLVLKHQHALMRAFAEAYALAEEHWAPWPESEAAEDLFGDFLQLVESTADNENSMARDVRLKRATETAYLAGVARNYDGYPFLLELDGRLRGEILEPLKIDAGAPDESDGEPGPD